MQICANNTKQFNGVCEVPDSPWARVVTTLHAPSLRENACASSTDDVLKYASNYSKKLYYAFVYFKILLAYATLAWLPFTEETLKVLKC